MESKRSAIVMRLVMSLVLISLLAFGTIGQASAATNIIYVKATAKGKNNGTSWANAYKTLQPAIAKATAGKQIWVAKGTYKPATVTNPDRHLSFTLKNGVAIFGGFAGSESLLSQRNPILNVTILSGDIGTPVDTTDNSFHVVRSDSNFSTAILDGFTIKFGNANGDLVFDGTPPEGGGMYNTNSTATLRNLTFSANSARLQGGGMSNENSSPVLKNLRFVANQGGTIGGGGMFNYNSSPSLSHVTFINNSAGTEGGGLLNTNGSNPVLNSVTFSGNSATEGGGMSNEGSNPSLTKVTFSNNHATGSGQGGGGMFNNNASAPTLNNVTFNANSSNNAGGGMYNNNGSDPVLTNVTFSGNTAIANGGGLANQSSDPNLTNVTFSGNVASNGAGVYNGDGSPVLKYVTLSKNTASVSGGAMYNDGAGSQPFVYNSILWGNAGGEIGSAGAPLVTLTGSIVKGGCPLADASCPSVFIKDPKLGPLANNGGFTKTIALGIGSAAIDKVACLGVTRDQRGVKRPQGVRCDMGAYELIK